MNTPSEEPTIREQVTRLAELEQEKSNPRQEPEKGPILFAGLKQNVFYPAKIVQTAFFIR